MDLDCNHGKPTPCSCTKLCFAAGMRCLTQLLQGEPLCIYPRERALPQGVPHQETALLEISALALLHSKFPAKKKVSRRFPLVYSGSCNEQNTVKTTPAATRKNSEAKEQANYYVPGRDAGWMHNQTPSHQQDHLSKSTYFNLADCPRQAGSFPRCSQQRQQSLFDVLTCPPQASYTLFVGLGGKKKKKNSDYF